MPLIIKIVLSTAHIDRVKIFDLLLNHNGVLNTNIIIHSLNVSKPTALKIIGLVDKSEDVYDENVNNKVRHIYLNKERYSWFLSDDFKKLREGFIPLDYSKTTTAAITNTSPSDDVHDDFTEEENKKEEDNDISSRLLPAPLYRIGHTDIIGCNKCRLKCDIHFMKKHPCMFVKEADIT